MSFEYTNWAYNQPIKGAGRKSVLVLLADTASENGYSFRGQESIARMTGQSVRSVRMHLDWLEANGYLRRRARFKKNGDRTSDEYFLPVLTTGKFCIPEESTTGKKRKHHRQKMSSPPAEVAGEPSEEPSEEPKEGAKEKPSSFIDPKDGANQSVKASGSEPKREPRRKFDAASMVPPAHVTPSLWDDFVAHRKELKAPLTERAARIILNKLVRARDADDALENAIANGWKGVFPKDVADEPLPPPTEVVKPVRQLRYGSVVQLPDGSTATVTYHEVSTGLLELEGGTLADYEAVKILEEAE